jgi:uncharacterized membrane protein YdbT with pleckstrin-like domain
MRPIKTTYKPMWLSLIWSGVLAYIPTIVHVVRISTTKYNYNDGNLVIQTGVFTKKQSTIPFYRVTDVQAQKNIFGYGKVTISDKMGVTTLRAIAKPLETAHSLQLLRVHAQNQSNVVHNDIF